jgi:DNA-binding NarL/FixJ family response regulator
VAVTTIPITQAAMMNSPVKLLLVDDHAMVRDMLRRQIDAEPDLRVVVAAADMDAAIALSQGVELDLAVLDIEMPGLCVFEGVERLRETHPGLRVMFLSGIHSDRNIQRAMDARACGYASKSETLPDLLRAIRAVAGGQSYFSPQIRERLQAVGLRGDLVPLRTPLDTLTRRELEILDYVARGLSKKEIARITATSVKTVEQHCGNLMAKLGIHDRVMLARYAIREGVCRP